MIFKDQISEQDIKEILKGIRVSSLEATLSCLEIMRW